VKIIAALYRLSQYRRIQMICFMTRQNNIPSILPVNWSGIIIGFYDDLERCGDEDMVAFTPHRLLYVVRTYDL